MKPTLAALAVTAFVATGCGPDRSATPDEGATPTSSDPPAVFDLATPTPAAEPTLTPADAPPPPTPTTRVIGPVAPPSDAATQCTEAGLVAAALDACLRYSTGECTATDTADECELAREQLEVVLGTRIFPSDCADLDSDQLAGAPAWCDMP